MRWVQSAGQRVCYRVNPPAFAGLVTRPKRSRDMPGDEDHFEARTAGIAANRENRADGCLDGSLLPDFAAQCIGRLFAGRDPTGNDPRRMAVPERMSTEENPTIGAEKEP